MINIIEKTYNLNGTLQNRTSTNRIMGHHTGSTVLQSADDIDRYHKSIGYTCIGYHFYIRKTGEIFRGRREDVVGAHAIGDRANYDSVGVCFEGNFEVESMTEAQIKAGQELIAYLKNKYSISRVQAHRDVNATACPGKNFPFDEIVNVVEENKVEGGDEEVRRYENGSTVENVYADTSLTNKIGSLNPRESCDCFGIFENRAMVRYKVDGTNNYKIGFCKWLDGVK